jgi:glycogen debranching enzyme
MLKYTLLDCHSDTKIQLKPYLAFRSRHSLSKANEFANTKYEVEDKGVSFKLYQGYTPLYIQANKNMEYIHSPNWYNNIEYFEEQQRGYDYQEDLLVPGYFEFPLKKGESIIIAAGTAEVKPSSLPRNNFKNTLINSAEQFIVKRDGKTEVIAGYHWYRRWGRDTFIALPGLTLAQGKIKECKAVLDTIVSEMSGPLFPNLGYKSTASYNSIDAPLWFFWTLQQYAKYTSNSIVWKQYGAKMKLILRGYRAGTLFNIKMQDNGLVYGGEKGKSLTWMDAISSGKPVTPRIGYDVEINALAYNAIMFALELAKENNDTSFINEFQNIADGFPKVFMDTFWNDKYSYLADYVNGDYKDWSIRPNMLIAVSLPYSPLKKKYMKSILEMVEKELLTTRGLRTLSPNHSDYEGEYFGDQNTRDSQYHQGTVWPWLIGPFADAYIKVYGKSRIKKLDWYIERFEEVITEHGVGSISEIYDGNPPHTARGTISQAISVGELLRAIKLVEDFDNNERRDAQ